MTTRKKKKVSSKPSRMGGNRRARRRSGGSFFQGANEAERGSTRAPKTMPGKFVIEVLEVLAVEGRRDDWFVVPMKILMGGSRRTLMHPERDDFEQYGPGGRMGWRVKMSGEMAFTNCREFVSTAMGQDFEETLEEDLDAAASDEQPLAGTILEVEFRDIETKNGHPFAVPTWTLIGNREDYEAWREDADNLAAYTSPSGERTREVRKKARKKVRRKVRR